MPLYFAAPRPTVERDGLLLMVDDERFPLKPGETPEMRSIRFRTLGCYPLTGAVESEATTLAEVIQEMLLTTTSERQGRAIDHDAGGAGMEKKKQEGLFLMSDLRPASRMPTQGPTRSSREDIDAYLEPAPAQESLLRFITCGSRR